MPLAAANQSVLGCNAVTMDVYEAILTRSGARDLEPSCNSALQEELQDVRNAIRQAMLALERLREVERAAQQVALERTSSSAHVTLRLLESAEALQLQLISAMAKTAKPEEVRPRS